MTMFQPAWRWEDALPVGNGELGAMLFGRVTLETVLLNHKHLHVPVEKPTMPDVSMHLAEWRDLLGANRFVEAETFLVEKLTAGGLERRAAAYQPAGAIFVDQEPNEPFRDYRRGVDFQTGAARVEWTDGPVRFRRELSVSRADDVIVLSLESDTPGAIRCTVRLGAFRPETLGAGSRRSGVDPELSFRAEVVNQDLRLTGTFHDGSTFGSLGRCILTGGAVEVDGDKLHIRGADRAVILVKQFVAEPAEAAFAQLAAQLAAIDPDAAIARSHIAHRELFDRMRLSLADGDDGTATNEDLLRDGYNGDVPVAMVERMFDFGRHLLISSSDADGWPANLQGVWNGRYDPPWCSDYHNDENIQMNYWQALGGALPEAALSLVTYFEHFLDDFRENARKLYGCRGIWIPISMTTHGLADPSLWVAWTAAAGWLAQHVYDVFLFTGDRDYLRDRALPLLKEVAAFYEDFLTTGADGKLQSAPSVSPENRPGRVPISLVNRNAAMDFAVIREVLCHLCDGCELLGIDAVGVARWREMLAKLPDYVVNEDGALAEWIDPDLPDNYRHRHLSHIYGLFPGWSITAETQPELYEAVRVAVEKRRVVGQTSQSGWSLAHMANIYARLGDGDRALGCLEILCRACVGDNLLTYHNDWRGQGLTLEWPIGRVFQIDANLGIAAAVLEMLVFSGDGMVKLLPALPGKWPVGCVEGLRCRGALTVSIQWDIPAGRSRTIITADADTTITCKLPPGASACVVAGAEAVPHPLGPAYRRLTLKGGQAATLDVSL